MNNQPHHHHHHYVPSSNNNTHNNNYLISSPYHTTLPSSSSEQQNQQLDKYSQSYHQIQHSLSSLLQQREHFLLDQHQHHNASLNQWELKEKTIHHILEKLSIQKQKLSKKLKKLKQDVYKMHNIEKNNKMSQLIGTKSKQHMPPPQPSMSLSSQQVLATPLSLLLDDPSIGDSQTPVVASQTPKHSSSRNAQPSLNTLNQRKKVIHSINLTANSTTTSAAPYSVVLDSTPNEMNNVSEIPSTVREERRQMTNSVPNLSSTVQATNSSIVFTNNPSF